MRIKSFAACLLAVLVMLFYLPVTRADTARAAEDLAAYADEILVAQTGGLSVQEWINAELLPKAGQSSADFYVLALAAQGCYDLTPYGDALLAMLKAGAFHTAVERERAALVCLASLPVVPAVCETVLEENAEELGIMSRIYALHLANNGVSAKKYDIPSLVAMVTERQCADGGWAVSGSVGDADVTAMALQALAPYRETTAQETVERGVAFLSQKQLPSGAYRSYGVENPESTAQVWLALTALGVKWDEDTRFLKNGHTLLDGILQFRCGAGKYAHFSGGTSNAMAATQVCLAMTAAQIGRSPYLFREMPVLLPSETTALPVVTTTAASTALAIQTELTGRTTSFGINENTNVWQIIGAEKSTAATTTSFQQSTLQTAQTAPSEKGRYGYRLPLTVAITIVYGAAAAVCVARRRRSAKTHLTLAALAAAGIAAVWLIRIETPAQYYAPTGQAGGGSVTIEIRCDAILGLDGAERFGKNGIILPKTECTVSEGETVLALLQETARANRLQIEADGISGTVVETAYVRGIASLYEMDFGDLSGWVYTVNGERPSVGCGAYVLSDGDAVVWEYTLNL